MPNWAQNHLNINGPQADLEDFKVRVELADNGEIDGETTPLCLSNLLPMPAELEGTTSPGDSPNWFDWRIENWGTKWDTDDANVEWVKNLNNEDSLFYAFLTAWSCPDKWLKTISKLFPALEFELRSCDPSMDWDYHLIIKNGEISLEHEANFDDGAKDYWGYEEEEEEVEIDEDIKAYVNGEGPVPDDLKDLN